MKRAALFGPGIVDCNAFIGNWAFRRLRRNDAAGLLAMMDTFGIAQSCVASADAILYKDCHAGNEKLYEETQNRDDRFVRYATLNPTYAGWERDLAQCADWGFKALRLYPHYHGYRIGDPEAARIIAAATEAGWPVSVPIRVVDMRQRHWMDVLENLDPLDLLAVAEKHPETTFVLSESYLSWPRESDHWKRMHALPFYVELSRMTSALDKSIEILVGALGPDRVLFGTGFPFKTPSPAFLKLQILEADAETKDAIAGGNARRLFAIG
jgi:hypothetical protein